jgi:hypothetical protein
VSCSTTFELGVDVGELQAVLLRNVPPTTANYVQRAGRAGRRTDSAALVVTYAQRRSHDLVHYRDPTRMISGVVRAPRVTVDNDRIARRHAHAIALAAYFRHATSDQVEFRTVADLFGDERRDGQLVGWLQAVPEAVVEAIRRALPSSVHDRVGIGNGAWVDHLVTLVEDLANEHRQDIEVYRGLEKEASAGGRYNLAQMYQRVIHTLERRQLIAHLSAHNVLPKYGFPVDTVELRTNHIGTAEAQRVELTRDLKLAISDYAPGSQLVAAGLQWESAGIYRFPDRELPQRHYVACSCGWYEQGLGPIEAEACPGCGRSGRQAPRSRTYLQPEFGFVASRAMPRRPSTRPVRVYSGTVHLVDASLEGDPELLALSNGAALEHRYAERGELAVINEGLHGRGYRICRWCGAGRQVASGKHANVKHEHPQTGRDCRGPSDWVSLGHVFETDVLEIRFSSAVPAIADVWWGLLYAVVEAAAEHLVISRDDIDGTLHLQREGPPTLILFDDVPAGAGHVRRLRERLPDVLEGALRRVSDCECGEETSCYRCLRGFRNQRMHERLRRGAVADLLVSLIGRDAPSRMDDELWSEATVTSFEAYDGELVRLQSSRNGVTHLWEGKLWVEAHAGEVSSLMLEPSDGGPVQFLEPDECVILAVSGGASE